MNKSENISHQEQRKNLWGLVWAHVASANDCKRPDIATAWADNALKAFDERFPEPKEVSGYGEPIVSKDE